MIRAVLDSNVIVSAFIRPQSTPGSLLEMLIHGGAFEMILSSALLDELRRALTYDKVRSRISASNEELDLKLALLDILAIPVEPAVLSGVAPDPGDDIVLAAAVEGRADYVVTGDQPLLAMQSYEGIRIISPSRFMEILTSS